MLSRSSYNDLSALLALRLQGRSGRMALRTLVVAQSEVILARIKGCITAALPEAEIELCRHEALPNGIEVPPDLIVLDPPPELTPAESVSSVAEHFPFAPLAIVGTLVDERVIEAALRAGALSYIPAQYTNEQFSLVLRLAVQGIGHRPNLLRGASMHEAHSSSAANGDQPDQTASQYKLTPRQIEVLAHAVEGLSNKQIANRLKVTEGVVRLHMSEIYRRLSVERRAEAIVKALRIKEVIKALVGRGEN